MQPTAIKIELLQNRIRFLQSGIEKKQFKIKECEQEIERLRKNMR